MEETLVPDTDEPGSGDDGWEQQETVIPSVNPGVDTSLNEQAAATSSSGRFADGQTFGDYQIDSEIARGGMGVVFRATQISLNRPVALKMILASHLAGDDEIRRFQVEAESAAKLDHPGIVPVFEVGAHDGQHFFSMGLVEGGSLDRLVKEGPLTGKQAAQLVKTIAESVQYAHARNIVHRDLKPGNVLLDGDGLPKVTDFGLAKNIEEDSGLTATGAIMGTPGYMAPEQAAGKLDEVGPLADVYALGGILYFLLTGRPPFRGNNPIDTIQQVLTTEATSPRQHNPGVDLDLATISLKCLEKDPTRRYASAGELAEELTLYLEGRPITARPVSQVERGWRWCRRNPVVASLGAIVSLLLLSAPFVAIRQIQLRTEAEGLLTEKNGLIEEKEGLIGQLGERNTQLQDTISALEIAENKALKEAGNSRAINEFLLEDLLGQADPYEEPDRDIKLRTILDRTASELDDRFDDPELEASIRYTIASVYSSLGDYEAALEHVEQSYSLRQVELGSNAEDTLKSQQLLAQSFTTLGRIEDAESLLYDAVAKWTRLKGENDENTLSCKNDLASCMISQARYTEAETYLSELLEEVECLKKLYQVL